jgi:ABC-type Mn2+/Zn2+ transport system permease subunit
MSFLLDPFQLPFMQRAAVEILLLTPVAALLGTQIVLRRQAFFAHGVGAGVFPGLVVAGPAGVPPALAAFGVGVGFATALERLRHRTKLGGDAATALLLVSALAIGTVLASDVFASGAEVDALLFGSLLAIGSEELATSALVLPTVLTAAALWRRAWIAIGFDGESAGAPGLRSSPADWALVVAIAVAVVAAVDAVGALLVSSILVIPAATAALYANRVRSLELAAAGIAVVEGLAGLWFAYQLDVPPGATIAVLGGAVFALCALERRLMPAGPRWRG